MRFIGIDLAERHSAAVVIYKDGTVLHETVLDTGPKEDPPNPFVKARSLAPWWISLREQHWHPEQTVIAVEDIPPHMMDPKPVLKLQGALIGYMALDDITAHLIRAKDWQDYFGYSKKHHGDSKKWATGLCEVFGYEPGCTMEPGTKILAKPKTDLRDAYLIARWLRDLCLG